MVNRTLPLGRKLAILDDIRNLVNNEGYSIRGACKKHRILPSLFRYWRQNEETYRNASSLTVKSANRGRVSILAPYAATLERWIMRVRQTGKTVEVSDVVKKVCIIFPAFRNKSIQAQRNCTYRFLKKHNFAYRRSTHVAQTSPRLTIREAQAFIAQTKPRFTTVTCHQDYILNMDQTCVYFSMHSPYTLDKKGTRDVHTRRSGNNSSKVTTAITVTASGKMLRPMIIFLRRNQTVESQQMNFLCTP